MTLGLFFLLIGIFNLSDATRFVASVMLDVAPPKADLQEENKMTFQKGQSGNPKGRPKKALIDKFEKAIKRVEKVQGKTIFQHFAERAFEDDGVLIAVMKKRLPDMKQVEGKIKIEVPMVPLSDIEREELEKAAANIAALETQRLLTEGENEEE